MFSDVNNDADVLRELNHESKETKESDTLHDELYEQWSKNEQNDDSEQSDDEQIIDVSAKMESDVKVEVLRIVSLTSIYSVTKQRSFLTVKEWFYLM